MSRMQLPIGFDDFREIIDTKLNFVDKSLFIKEVLDDISTKVAVITRPRRFGKTLNLSMLRYFLAAEIDGQSTKGLFNNLQIAQVPGNYLQYQGQYPIILLTFKDIKEPNFTYAYEKFQLLFARLFDEFTNLFAASPKLTAAEKELFTAVVQRTANRGQLEDCLKLLSMLLAKHSGKKVYILIDEYDTPIQTSYIYNYYDDMISFTRNLLSAALKTNSYLEKAVVTGVIRIAKESLFSGINNVKPYSVFHPKYSEYFGFTEEEVANLLVQANMQDKASEVRRWYNGYKFGSTIIYNPWSIVNCVNKNSLQLFWVNTSDSALIKKLIVQSPLEFKEQIEKLLQGETIASIIDEHVVFGDLTDNTGAIWSLLVTTGYLKIVTSEIAKQGFLCKLCIPNEELHGVYSNMLERWLCEKRDINWYNTFINSLLTGNIPEFAKRLTIIMEQVASVHDMAKEPEAFYHGLMLGFTASLSKDQYEIQSNCESGYGRSDIAIIPKDLQKPGIIIELKNEKTDLPEQLQQAADAALVQIEQKKYIAIMQQRNIGRIIKIGIAFCGKQFAINTAV